MPHPSTSDGHTRSSTLKKASLAERVTDDEAAPAGVGPHEGHELELMLAGKKPLAMFGDAPGSGYEIPEADFAPYVAAGRLVRREVTYRPPEPGVPGRFVYFACAGEEWRIETLHRINERLFVQLEPTSPEIEREIGRLLGYADTDIDQYLEWVNRRHGNRI